MTVFPINTIQFGFSWWLISWANRPLTTSTTVQTKKPLLVFNTAANLIAFAVKGKLLQLLNHCLSLELSLPTHPQHLQLLATDIKTAKGVEMPTKRQLLPQLAHPFHTDARIGPPLSLLTYNPCLKWKQQGQMGKSEDFLFKVQDKYTHV